MKTLSKGGPRTDPCGTPIVTFTVTRNTAHLVKGLIYSFKLTGT